MPWFGPAATKSWVRKSSSHGQITAVIWRETATTDRQNKAPCNPKGIAALSPQSNAQCSR
jgi:hypothetical protein